MWCAEGLDEFENMQRRRPLATEWDGKQELGPSAIGITGEEAVSPHAERNGDERSPLTVVVCQSPVNTTPGTAAKL